MYLYLDIKAKRLKGIVGLGETNLPQTIESAAPMTRPDRSRTASVADLSDLYSLFLEERTNNRKHRVNLAKLLIVSQARHDFDARAGLVQRLAIGPHPI